MNGYFREYIESHEGEEGDFYCEVKDGLIIRHVSVFNDIYYWATRQDCYDGEYDFTSSPEFDVLDNSVMIVSKDEFERIWNVAISQERQA